MKEIIKYQIIRDSNEKKEFGFRWNATEKCAGTVVKKLEVADYSISGMEGFFLIERKLSPSEIYKNLIGEDYSRFKKELIYLNTIKHSYIVFEFTVDELFGFPWNNPKIPKKAKFSMKSGEDIYYRISKWAIDYPNIQVIFAGKSAKKVVSSIFKRMLSLYPDKINAQPL